MFSYMERNADGAVVRLPKRDFDIHLMTFHVFAENPHLPHLVESVHNRSFRIVFWLNIQDNLLAVGRSDFQSGQCL